MSGDIPEMREEAFNEDLIVRYLLGDLPDEAQVEIEDRSFRDQQYLQRILAVEYDLIDEYARGELSGSERLRFERRFLASQERRRKVEFARALASVTTEHEAKSKETLAARAPAGRSGALAAFLRGLNPAVRFALAAAALLILIGGPWLFIESQRLRSELAREQQSREQEQQALQQQLAEERARSEEAAARLERDEQRERSQEPARQMEPSPEESTTRTAPPAVVSLALSPGISRGGGARPKLLLPQATGRARLQIGIEPEDQYSRFSVELRAQGGQRVWAEDNLRARAVRGGRTVVLYLPGNILRDGQYELTLKGVTGEGAVEEIGYYYFDVLKK
jgi:hypothetical protein